MRKNNFYKRGRSLIGIILVLVVIGLISGGLYYYFSRQVPEEIVKLEEITPPPEEKLPKEEVAPPKEKVEEKPIIQKCTDGTLYGQCSTSKPKYCDNGNLVNKCGICGCSLNQVCQADGSCKIVPQKLLLLVEDNLYEGLTQELNTYSNDVKREFDFETITKTFPSSASVFEIKSYVKQIYNNYKLNGVLLVGDLPSGKMYHPKGYYAKDNLPLYDYIYQDVYDACKYSKEWDAFDFSPTSCQQNRIQPFWISRLTPDSSTKSALSLLKDYFKRNHEYRTGQYSYERKILLYEPVIWEEVDPYRTNTISGIKNNLKAFNMYDENGIVFIDAEKENSDQLYLNEIKKPYRYELLYVNAHGTPTFHGKNITPNDISDVSFFLGEFVSCSVGRFIAEDYIAGNYLFNGKGLVVFAAPVVIFGTGIPNPAMHYLLSIGEPLYEAIKVSPLGGSNAFGDLTLRMRYIERPTTHQPNDPIISIEPTKLYFTNTQPKMDLKIRNLGNSPLKLMNYMFLQSWYYTSKEEWQEGLSFSSWQILDGDYSHFFLNPQSEIIYTANFPTEAAPPPGAYKGEIFILSNDPINPYLTIPFEAVVK